MTLSVICLETQRDKDFADGCLIKDASYYGLLLAEGHLHRWLFGKMLRRIWALQVPSRSHSDCGCKIWGPRKV